MFFIKFKAWQREAAVIVRAEAISAVSEIRGHQGPLEGSSLLVGGTRVSVAELPSQVLALVRFAQTQAHPAKQVVGLEDL